MTQLVGELYGCTWLLSANNPLLFIDIDSVLVVLLVSPRSILWKKKREKSSHLVSWSHLNTPTVIKHCKVYSLLLKCVVFCITIIDLKFSWKICASEIVNVRQFEFKIWGLVYQHFCDDFCCELLLDINLWSTNELSIFLNISLFKCLSFVFV